MPGRGSYGPGGKWIHDRAHHILGKGDLAEKHGPEKAKRIAYAISTQQAHKLGKTPKRGAGPRGMYGTQEGKAEARAKYDQPKREYVKTPAPKTAAAAGSLMALLEKAAIMEDRDPETGLSVKLPTSTISSKPKSYSRTNFSSVPPVKSVGLDAKMTPPPRV